MIRFHTTFTPPGLSPAFKPGDIVCHRRYAYRGVIVDLDTKCQASREWHESNQTQPDRNQPWYYVLVHGGPQTTYVAEENLEIDKTGHLIMNPLVEAFFNAHLNGSYVRNDRPWPRER